VVGTLTLVYDHHVPNLSQKLTEMPGGMIDSLRGSATTPGLLSLLDGAGKRRLQIQLPRQAFPTETPVVAWSGTGKAGGDRFRGPDPCGRFFPESLVLRVRALQG
jgi:hypothetical protein